MSAALSAVYARFGVQPDADIAANEDMLPGLQALLATNLNGVALRGELALLCEAADKANAAMEDAVAAASDARADAAATRRWAAKLEEDLGATRTWATKIEADVAALNVEIARRDELIRELTQGVDWLKREMERLAADKDQLAADKDRLAADKDRLALHKAAFDLLPPFARDYLLRKAARAGR